MEKLTIFFKAISHPVRRQILNLVRRGKARNLQEIEAEFSLSHATILRHVHILTQAKLLRARRDRGKIWYEFDAVEVQQRFDEFSREL